MPNRLTGSVALDSDALETVANVVAALGALVALWSGERRTPTTPMATTRPSTSAPWPRARQAVAEPWRVVSAHAGGALEAHDVRTRTAGSVTFVEFHLVVPGRVAVEDAHAICDRVERALRERAGQAVIHIHVEPEGKAKQRGVPVVG
jgi:divalent metal cation (Fe/Co/Zn/Cd) transporter